jgi:putative inorganic carbon (HCO3(-)) transporter
MDFHNLGIICIGLSLGVAAFLWLIGRPFYSLLLALFLIPFERLGLIQTPLFGFRAYYFAFAYVWFVFITAIFVQKKPYKFRTFSSRELALPFGLFLMVNIISAALSFKIDDIRMIVYFLFYFCIFILIDELVIQRQQVHRVINIIIISGAVVAGFGLLQYLLYLSGSVPPTTHAFGIEGSSNLLALNTTGMGTLGGGQWGVRLNSFFFGPNEFGGFLSMVIPFCLAFSLYKSDFKARLIYGFVSVILIIALLLTMSRSSWIAAIAGILVLLALRKKSLIKWIKHFVIFLLICGIIILLSRAISSNVFSLDFVLSRFLDLSEYGVGPTDVAEGYSSGGRIDFFLGGIKAWIENPFFGVGPAEITDWSDYLNIEFGFKSGRFVAHNTYLDVLVGSGLLGITAFLWMFGLAFSRTIKIFKHSTDTFWKIVATGCMGSIVAVFVNGMGMSKLVYPDWSLIIIFCVTFYRVMKQEQRI